MDIFYLERKGQREGGRRRERERERETSMKEREKLISCLLYEHPPGTEP